jgi:hypothetical protein
MSQLLLPCVRTRLAALALTIMLVSALSGCGGDLAARPAPDPSPPPTPTPTLSRASEPTVAAQRIVGEIMRGSDGAAVDKVDTCAEAKGYNGIWDCDAAIEFTGMPADTCTFTVVEGPPDGSDWPFLTTDLEACRSRIAAKGMQLMPRGFDKETHTLSGEDGTLSLTPRDTRCFWNGTPGPAGCN